MKKELLQQALDAAQRETVPPMAPEGITAWWFAKGWHAAIAQPEQPAAPVAQAEPMASPYVTQAQLDRAFPAPVAQAEPDRAPLVRFNLDCHFEGMDQRREFVMASDHDARVHDLETLCDPAGIVVENALLKHQTRELVAMIERLKREAAQPIGGEVTDADSRDAGQAEGGAA